jgi:pyruvate,orthophosphate dikinase
VCSYFYAHQQRYPKGFEKAVAVGLKEVEKILGRCFGDPANPLLVSVRSGARESMPGMMDTVLNLGLNDHTVEGLAARSKNPRFAYDSYRRFVQMYADVVMGLKSNDRTRADPLTQILDGKKARRGIRYDTELTADDLRELVSEYKSEIKSRLGKEFPEDPYEQLWGAIGAVFGSWNNDRAIAYRELYRIPHQWGTAVSVQAMVFGNRAIAAPPV